MARLSIRRDDRRPDRDWRHHQAIKNQLAGPEVEAVELFPAESRLVDTANPVELFPAESRLVDTANQTWLWVAAPGDRFPFGFDERVVTGTDEAAKVGAVQREPGVMYE